MSTANSDRELTGGDGRKRRRSLRGEVGATGARFGSSGLRRQLEGDPPAGEHAEEPPPPRRRRRSLRGEVGATGARFGSAALRKHLDSEDADRTDNTDHAVEPIAPPVPAPLPPPPPAVEEEEFPEEVARGSLVRPYAWTGGRTTAGYDLRLETLVSLEENGIATAMRDTSTEQRAVVEVCAVTRSVAEVSALMAVPLGVARVLLSDLISMGVVAAHDNAAASGGPDLLLLERVLRGLREL
ncbi:DUF742 domain-containing protein [Actinosynnema sp. NPDC020468]|uniref:DUF742 domain-containing protein n=1 Tax=Actinosynnema sp. NPDC020468 TaxID=3154488 RepID=UPI0033EA1403